MTKKNTTLAIVIVFIAVVTISGTISVADAVLFMKVGDATQVKGDVKLQGYQNWITIESYSHGVDRDLGQTGEKAGTKDINLGVGELKEISVLKSLDSSSAQLAQHSVDGNSLGTVEIHRCDAGGKGMLCSLEVKIDRAFVKSWSISGDADDRPTEKVSLVYNKFGMTSYSFDGKLNKETGKTSWDVTKNTPWSEYGAKGGETVKQQAFLPPGLTLEAKPYAQIASGVAAEDVKCNVGFEKMKRAANGVPVCLKTSSVQAMIDRGWAEPFN